MLVTLVGFDILRGRQLLIETNASDFEHLIVACLFHDIGYVRGILKGDSADGYIIDAKGNKAELSRGSSDAALMPYRVDRSKLFVMDRVAKIKSLDAARIANAIECTRYGTDDSDSDSEEGMLVRAAESHRPARRSAISAQSQCALLRVRGSRKGSVIRLCFAGRSHRSISEVLLEQRIGSYPERHALPQHHVEWTAVDRQSPQQYLSRRARTSPTPVHNDKTGVFSSYPSRAYGPLFWAIGALANVRFGS